MELEDDLGDGLGEVVGCVGGADVECPAVGGGGVGVDVVFAEVECDGSVGDREAACGVGEAVVGVGGGGGVVRRHGHMVDFALVLGFRRVLHHAYIG